MAYLLDFHTSGVAARSQLHNCRRRQHKSRPQSVTKSHGRAKPRFPMIGKLPAAAIRKRRGAATVSTLPVAVREILRDALGARAIRRAPSRYSRGRERDTAQQKPAESGGLCISGDKPGKTLSWR